MNCRQFKQSVHRYVDGELDEARKQYDQHLEECASCRAEVEQLNALARELAAFEPVEPPRGLVAGILVQAGRARPDPAPGGTWMLWPATVAASVVAVVLGYLAGGAAFTYEPPPQISQSVVAQVAHESMLQEAFALLPGAEDTLVLLAFNDETEGNK